MADQIDVERVITIRRDKLTKNPVSFLSLVAIILSILITTSLCQSNNYIKHNREEDA